MASEVLTNVAESFKEINPTIKEAEELIQALKDAGEDTTQLQADLNAMKVKRDKWQRMLSARGLLKP